jgi:hypothetical protein
MARTRSAMSSPRPAREPLELRRGDLRGLAVETYIPRRGRGARHYADTFSCALWLAKLNVRMPGGQIGAGDAYAPLWGATMAPLVPEGTDLLVCPPRSATSALRPFYLAEALGIAVGQCTGIRFAKVLRWTRSGPEASKEIVHQGGKGRALGRRAECGEDLRGRRVCLVDDLFTTGITAERCAEALQEAGAESVFVVCLGMTERTVDRPAEERARITGRAERTREREAAR